MNLYLDIETIPSQDPTVRAELAAAVTAPAQYKKPESIAEWLDANREAEAEAALLKTSFDGGLGQIVCIGWAFDDHPPETITVSDLAADSEKTLLRDWFAMLNSWYRGNSGTKPTLIGHNHVAFDLPFILKRCVVHGVKPPFWWPRDPKPWSDATFDTMTAWAGARERISMDRLCRVLGIPGKGDISGADVWPMVQDGRLAEVATYCKGDIERTRAIHQRLTFANAA